MSCPRCTILQELYECTAKNSRQYWLMTELFVLLHGSDECKYEEYKLAADACFAPKANDKMGHAMQVVIENLVLPKDCKGYTEEQMAEYILKKVSK